jgi:putative methyltransferase (TIGR04325 family)
MSSQEDGAPPDLPWNVRGLRRRARWVIDTFGSTHAEITATRRELAAQGAELSKRLSQLDAEQARALEALRSISDREPWQRERLHELRRSDAYEQAYTDEQPLVSIVIPTYDNHEALRERALPSALAQTHERIEVIVVGDEAPPETAAVIDEAADERVRFFNRPLRGPYPADPEQRWYVAGGPPFNEAVALASGAWLAPLDDDDAFMPDHVERLLEHARAERAELAYGLIRQHRPGGVTDTLGAFPPKWGEFNLQAAIYHAGLGRIFATELADAVFEEPYDWSLARRMLRAGVRFSMLEEEVLDYYPSRYWAPRWDRDPGEPAPEDSVEAAERAAAEAAGFRPEWELAIDGWEIQAASASGWDAGAVAEAYRRKWPEFLRSIDGPGPLGVAHETPTDAPMRRDDPISQNIVLAYGHALATAATGRSKLSVLDWGGATGHYYELGRRLSAVELEWHIRELAAVCAVGAELEPEVQFHDSDECLERDYDLVLASGSLQYVEDWRELLGKLAAVAKPWLFINRIPAVETVPRYPALQRAQAYGYETEYVGWVFHRGELVEAAADFGMELVREYALVEPIAVAGAPENPRHIGLLLRATS